MARELCLGEEILEDMEHKGFVTERCKLVGVHLLGHELLRCPARRRSCCCCDMFGQLGVKLVPWTGRTGCTHAVCIGLALRGNKLLFSRDGTSRVSAFSPLISLLEYFLEYFLEHGPIYQNTKQDYFTHTK